MIVGGGGAHERAMRLEARMRVDLAGFVVDVDLDVPDSSVTAILGPNGAGKTTVLRCLAGTIGLDAGRIQLGSRVLDDPGAPTFMAVEQRRVGYVHQDLLLFPHLSVVDNVAFGLRSRGARRDHARKRATEWLERVGLADRSGARPATLSGGQAQRVALARVLVTEPDLLLLDEPLAALDASSRGTMRRDLRRYLDDFDGPAIVVTHDPLDAMALADHLVVLEAGAVTQSGRMGDVTSRPRTSYVAELVGTNLVTGVAQGHEVICAGATVVVAEPLEGSAFVTISPSSLTVHAEKPLGSARNTWHGHICEIELLGSRVRLLLEGPPVLVAEITPASLADLRLEVGNDVWVSVKATEVKAYLR